MTRLKQPPISINCLSELPLALGERVLAGAIKNRDEYQEKKRLESLNKIEDKHDSTANSLESTG